MTESPLPRQNGMHAFVGRLERGPALALVDHYDQLGLLTRIGGIDRNARQYCRPTHLNETLRNA